MTEDIPDYKIMATTVVADRVCRRASVVNSRNSSIICSITPEVRPFKGKYSKSGSFDVGEANEGSVYIISVQDDTVNAGFVEEKSDEDVSFDCGRPQTEGSLSGQLDIINQSTEAGETKMENISARGNEQDKT